MPQVARTGQAEHKMGRALKVRPMEEAIAGEAGAVRRHECNYTACGFKDERRDKTLAKPSAEETREAYEEALRRAGYDPNTAETRPPGLLRRGLSPAVPLQGSQRMLSVGGVTCGFDT